MNAYSELYVEKAQIALGDMLHYAVYDLRMEASRFYKMFLSSGIARSFGRGVPKYTVGMSGVELAQDIVHVITDEYPDVEPEYTDYKTPEYWAGWAVAYYEWWTATPFDRIEEIVPVSEIIEMYDPLHEADIMKFVDVMNTRMQQRHEDSRLARLRAYAEMSQWTLGCSMEDLMG